MSTEEVLAERLKEYRELLEVCYYKSLADFAKRGDELSGKIIEKMMTLGIGDPEQGPIIKGENYGESCN